VTASARTAGLVAAELARDPGNGAAAAMAGLLAASLDSLGGIAGRLADAEEKRAFDQAVVEEACARAVAEDRAAWPRSRRLRVL
jgi:hypothetical protein